MNIKNTKAGYGKERKTGIGSGKGEGQGEEK